MGNGFLELFSQISSLNGFHRTFHFPVLRTFLGQCTQHHLRVLCEILIDGKAFCAFPQLRPLRICNSGRFPLLKEQNIRHNIRSGISPERIIGQSDCSQQIGSLSKILSCRSILLIHRAG